MKWKEVVPPTPLASGGIQTSPVVGGSGFVQLSNTWLKLSSAHERESFGLESLRVGF